MAEREAGSTGIGTTPQGTDGTAERILTALTHAARDATPHRLGRQLDAEAVALATGVPNLDSVLAAVPLERWLGLLERCTGYAKAGNGQADPASRKLCWQVLDLVRRPTLLRQIEVDQRDVWAAAILAAVEVSHLSVGPLFRQRAELYGSKVLFEIPGTERSKSLSWRQVATRVEFLSRGLLSLDSSETPAPIAILSDNRLEMALLDLACLTAGLVNVLIPANATEEDVAYMLEHSAAGAVIVSDTAQLDKVQRHRERLPNLQRVIAMDAELATHSGVMTLDELSTRATHIPASLVTRRSEAVRVDDLATIMYTSGTTGMPKGIRFSHRNLVFKRFARALALPEIGDEDRFLCYLPLYHTFGRFLELMGCVFWGSTYCFVENTSLEALLDGMTRYRPTVFISIPKRWIQLYETITRHADPDTSSDEQLLRATRAVTGGELRWGLSAAGHLDAEIFTFFQQQQVELMSGFGMTEATGGITMTPPQQYREDSLGVALPGIELKLAADGELLVRGPYVMIGYFDPPDGKSSFNDEGWLHTGDLMERTPEGHLRLIDRKKEIYKNIKGQTIAPQRVEKPFRDFESVGRVFLVGDHREYNTLLIYPNMQCRHINLAELSAEALLDHFRSLIVSVNKFLAPYERILDFAIIDRDLSEEHGELTAKGTARRSIVARNFADVIRSLYRRASLEIDNLEVQLPNWLLQALGLTTRDVQVEADGIAVPRLGTKLTLRGDGARVQVGSCHYAIPGSVVPLGRILTEPRMWLGNRQLVDFLPLKTTERVRPSRRRKEVQWIGPLGDTDPALSVEITELANLGSSGDWDWMDLHRIAWMLEDAQSTANGAAIDAAQRLLGQGSPEIVRATLQILGRVAGRRDLTLQRQAFLTWAPAESDARFKARLPDFLEGQADLFDDATREAFAGLQLSPAKVDALIETTDRYARADASRRDIVGPLVELLATYGAVHPVSYRRVRALFNRLAVTIEDREIQDRAAACLKRLELGFRSWLGPASSIAVDPDSGEEYGWADVTVFDDNVEDADRRRILEALSNTTILREAVFLFSAAILINLSDIPRDGLRIRLLGARHGKSVYRATVQTRFRGVHEMAINVNHTQSAAEVEEEIQWLIISGDVGTRSPVVEDFGGYWKQHDLWSEEFISGETLTRALTRLASDPQRVDRLRHLWGFLIWSTLAAYVDFWHRSGKRWEVADPGLANVIVPTEDFHMGARIVSLSARRHHRGLFEMLQGFHEQLIRPAERQYPQLAGRVGWPIVFSSLLEVVGEEEGLALLEANRTTDESPAGAKLHEQLKQFTSSVRRRGFVPMRLHFAIERYRRWEELGEEATPHAKAKTLQELFETYGLQRLAGWYPAVRFRFFRDTVFRNSQAALVEGLDQVIHRVRLGQLQEDEFVDAVSDLRSRLTLGEEDEYFLTRLSFPHLRPEDRAGFVNSSLGGRYLGEIVVTLHDHEGHAYRVRHALNAKEVERLHRLFLNARLEVRFRPEHQYLVALNERGQIVGGIFYELTDEGSSAHLEKIVVAERQRRKGLAGGLMTEFFNRLRAAGARTVTTGFFRPEYFYDFGFSVEKQYAGLVKQL